MLKAAQPLLTTIPIDHLVVVCMLIFARVGACIIMIPAIGSPRLPMKQRLFLAIALSFAMLGLIGPDLVAIAKKQLPSELLMTLASETLVGLSFGIAAHLFIWTAQFFATVLAMVIGYSGQPGHGVIESTPETPLTALISLAVLMLFFAADLHLEVLRGLLHSYQLVPITLTPRPQAALIDFSQGMSKAFLTVSHIAAPFLVYAILANFSVGLLNKLTPAIPVYFITVPMVLVGGLFLCYFLLPELLNFFTEEMRSFIE